jgi:regulator of cell morphogenesis and NO signaling
MTVTASETVSEIVAANPSSARTFEKYGIDFCCGGNKPLAEVCSERGLSVEELSHELTAIDAPAPQRDWRKAPLAELTDHIIGKHHEYLRAEMPAIASRIDRVLEAHREKHGGTISAVREVFVTLKEELAEHMMKEERVLFPAIRRMEATSRLVMPAGAINQPICMMEHEHATAGQAWADMRRLTDSYAVPEDACNTFRVLYRQLEDLESDLHVHIHLENNILFPRAVALEHSIRG